MDLADAQLNKGSGYTTEEKVKRGLEGLLPPRVVPQHLQAQRAMEYIRHFDQPLDKYVYLMNILLRNERLFFKIIMNNVMELMPIIYTPTVGEACQKFGKIFGGCNGMWISIRQHKGRIFEILNNWYVVDSAVQQRILLEDAL